MTSDKGFALIGALVLAPLLLAAVALVAGALIAISAQRRALHSCRTSMLEAQSELARGLRALTALNPEAERLRAEVRAAQTLAESAPDPVTRSAALARLATLRAQQTALDSRQRGLIALSEARARAATADGARAVQRSYAEVSRAADAPELSNAVRRSPKMLLRRSPPLALAPSYFADARADREQIAGLRWRAHLSSLLPAWIPLSDDSRLAQTEGTCSASVETSLEAKENQWQPRLVPDRAL